MLDINRRVIAAIRDCLADPNFAGCKMQRGSTSVHQLHRSVSGVPGYNRYIQVRHLDEPVATVHPLFGRIVLCRHGLNGIAQRSRANAVLAEFSPRWGVRCKHGRPFMATQFENWIAFDLYFEVPFHEWHSDRYSNLQEAA